MNLRGATTKELRAELARRERVKHKRWMEKWREQNHCRLESCNESLLSQESKVIETLHKLPRFSDGSRNFWADPKDREVESVTICVSEECDAGHTMVYHLMKFEGQEPVLSHGPYLTEREWVFTHEL